MVTYNHIDTSNNNDNNSNSNNKSSCLIKKRASPRTSLFLYPLGSNNDKTYLPFFNFDC